MLVRASAQRRELAIRQALGATRGSLARRLLVESGVLALAGAALGLLLARWCVPVLVALSPAAMPRAQEIRISLAVLGFTLAAALLAALAFGCVPALRAARALPGASLRSEGRAATGSRERGRARGWIVSGQVALMVVLLAGAGLLLRSYLALARVDPGFDPDVLTLRLSLPRKDYGELAKVGELYRRLEARVSALPGVVSVAAVNHVPMNGALASADYAVAERAPESEAGLPTAQYRMATPAYFATLGIPLIAGRTFGDDDRVGGAPVAIVSRALARRSFPGRSPIGQRLLVKDNQDGFRALEVVGLVGDVKHASLEADADPHLYVPYHQTHRDLLVWLTLNQYLVVRSASAPLALADGVARELRALDPNVAVADVRASGHYVEAAAAPRRFSLQLLACFAGLALALAALGIYGVASSAVAQRRREIGVRLALGARVPDVVGLVLREGMRRTAAGVALGLAAAAAIGRGLGGLLYGVRPLDLPTYAAVVALLAAVTLLACLAPAWRAGRVDPVEVLRLD
jgi:putative ABC transport system permease protein